MSCAAAADARPNFGTRSARSTLHRNGARGDFPRRGGHRESCLALWQCAIHRRWRCEGPSRAMPRLSPVSPARGGDLGCRQPLSNVEARCRAHSEVFKQTPSPQCSCWHMQCAFCSIWACCHRPLRSLVHIDRVHALTRTVCGVRTEIPWICSVFDHCVSCLSTSFLAPLEWRWLALAPGPTVDRRISGQRELGGASSNPMRQRFPDSGSAAA